MARGDCFWTTIMWSVLVIPVTIGVILIVCGLWITTIHLVYRALLAASGWTIIMIMAPLINWCKPNCEGCLENEQFGTQDYGCCIRTHDPNDDNHELTKLRPYEACGYLWFFHCIRLHPAGDV